MTNEALYSKVLDDLRDRREWERRQETWQIMRHDGLRRSSPPWPGAADMHFPLGDTFVERHKPFYIQQLRASEQLAQFTSQTYEGNTFSGAVSQWFDWQLKNRSNFQEEIVYAIDTKLEAGMAILQVTWNTEKKRLEYDAIDPIYFIVPRGTEKLQDADRMTKVWRGSKDAYKRNSNWNAEVADMIVGRTDNSGELQTYEQQRYERAGITYGEDKDEVVVWETYIKTEDGWKVSTYSPINPQAKIRDDFTLPYLHKHAPFVRFRYEIKDKGWYDTRGIVELAAPFESALCKHWNDQLDYMTLVNRPLFYCKDPMPNTANMRWGPGQILPQEVGSVQFAQPPMSFDTQINFTRSVAEYRVAMPDFGIGNAKNTSDPRTATEVSAITAVAGQNVDLRAFTFRLSLGEVYFQSFELLKQYARDMLTYQVEGQVVELTPEMVDTAFDIEPSGTADGSSKEQRIAKALARYEMLKNSPFVNQGELVKSLLEADDEGLVRRLFQDPNEKARTEYEDEASLIPAIKEGAPISPKPQQDQNARIQSVVDYIQAQAQMDRPPDPMAVNALQQRITSHLALLAQKNPDQAKQWEAQLQQLAQAAEAPPQ